jgi:hypothetical protein
LTALIAQSNHLISTGLISWSFNTIYKKRIPITADSIAWFDDINCPIKSNHNLANQNWNKMVGRRRPAAGGGLILSETTGKPKGHAGIVLFEWPHAAPMLRSF